MRRNPPAKWVLPETVDPETKRCIKIQVPDDPLHIAAFRGALLALASAYNWADDEAHTAKDVALVWRNILDNSLTWGCDVSTPQFRQHGTSCQWQISIDDGATWVDMPDYTQCAADVALSVVTDKINDGTLATGRQGQPGTKATPGSCQTFHGRIDAGNIWRLPVEVSAQDTVRIITATGGWWDGGETFWRCPSGERYALQQCVEGTEITQGTDPAPTVPHMKAIGHYGSVYVDCMGSAVTIPAGNSDVPFYIQANDVDISNNRGSIEFDVEVCTGGWCYEFDIAGLSTWSPWITGGHTYGAYNGSVGWVTVTFDQITIYAPDSCTFYHLEFEYTVNDTLGGTNHRDIAIGTANNPTATLKTEGLVVGANRIMTWDGTPQTGVPFVSMYNGTIGLQNSNIHRVRIFGLDAVCPFGTPNCT